MIDVTHFVRRPYPGAFSIERLYEDVRQHLPPDCRVGVYRCRHFSKGVWARLRDCWEARRHQSNVNHVTGDVHYLTYFLKKRRTVLTIHDCVALERYRGLARLVIWFFWYWLPVRRCCAIVVISAATRAQLLRSIRCDPDKIRVIHNNVSPEFCPLPKTFDEGCPRILQIGTGWNKNVERVAAALTGLSCRLVVIGRLSNTQRETLARHGIDYENHVGISRGALVDQYGAADMLVFVSQYEGFGLPIVEANAVGRPVVTSDRSSMPEVAGDAACLVDPFDIDAIGRGIRRVIADPAYRDRLVEAGFRNAGRFSASRVAEAYATLYRQVVKDATSSRSGSKSLSG